MTSTELHSATQLFSAAVSERCYLCCSLSAIETWDLPVNSFWVKSEHWDQCPHQGPIAFSCLPTPHHSCRAFVSSSHPVPQRNSRESSSGSRQIHPFTTILAFTNTSLCHHDMFVYFCLLPFYVHSTAVYAVFLNPSLHKEILSIHGSEVFEIKIKCWK